MALTDEQLAKHADRVVQRLCKWSTLFAGWQLGTRRKEDPEAKAVKDYGFRVIIAPGIAAHFRGPVRDCGRAGRLLNRA